MFCFSFAKLLLANRLSRLCKSCRYIHYKRFESENHTVTDIKDTCTVVYCLTHQDKKYTKFYTVSSKLLCEKCIATDHVGNKIYTISSVADDIRHVIHARNM